MSGSNWRIILAFAGLTLTGAQQPSEPAQTQKGGQQAQAATPQASTPPPSPEPTYRPYPDYNPAPCYNSEDHDSADLCAQWRAAIAAEKAAHEARRATNWAIVGTVLSLATIIGLIITIWQTSGALGEARRGNRLNLLFERRSRRESRRSAEDQAKALDIAERQFRISENASKAQIRAYLTIDRITPHSTTGVSPSVELCVKNVGQTPARITSAYMMFWAAPTHEIDPINSGPPAEHCWHLVDFMTQGAEGKVIVSCGDGTHLGRANEIDQGDVYIYGKIEFLDVFGDPHWMTFAHCPRIWGFDDNTEFRPCIHGNNSD